MATFNETCAITSRKYLSETTLSVPILSQKLQYFWSHCSVFALEKLTKKLNFHRFFIPKIIIGGYFQWNVCTHFEKICIWSRHEHCKFIRETSIFWSHSSFFLKNQPRKLNFSLSLKQFLVATSSNVNKVIRTISNLFILFRKIYCLRKKHKKHKKQIKSTKTKISEWATCFPFDVF